MPIWHNESRPPERAGFSLHRAGGRLRGIFSFHGKRISPLTPKRKALIGNPELEQLSCIRSESACVAALLTLAAIGFTIRFASASIIRCRSAHLVGVQPNFRLPPVSTMRRAKQCRYFARSLPPSKRHSRLTIVRRGCNMQRNAGIHGEAMYTAPDCAARAVLQAANPQCRGSRGPPLAFSWGSKGAILSRERMAPFPAFPAPRRESHCAFRQQESVKRYCFNSLLISFSASAVPPSKSTQG